jgi:hypothetical protein
MRKQLNDRLERGRILKGALASWGGGLHGAFVIMGPCGTELCIISSGYEPDWEHVSVSTKRRIPNWEEMCFVKNLFWEPEEAVMQLHPPQSDYVNCHPNCLHLWRPVQLSIPLPPSELVGPKS